MPTIKQLPLITQVNPADELPLSQGNFTGSVTVATLLGTTQPVLTLAPGVLLGRVSAGPGGPEAVGVGAGLAVAGGQVQATGADHAGFPAAAALAAGDEVVLNSGGAPRRLPATALRGLFSAGPGVQISAGGAVSATPLADASAVLVTARGTPSPRALRDRAADQVNARDFGAVLDGGTDDSTAIAAAQVVAGGTAVQLPSGTAAIGTQPDAVQGRFTGEGQLRTGDGHRRGRMFARRATEPGRYGSLDDISTAFDGDLSTVQLAIEHRVDGDATLTQPAYGYVYKHENSAVSVYYQNRSGWNAATGAQGGRTGCSAINGRITQEGQGDATFLSVAGTVFGTKAGSTHFLANPAVLILDGGLYAFADGTYQEVDEFSHNDAGFDVAVSSTVRNFYRTNSTGAKGAWWLGSRYQSLGSKAVDAAFQVVGKWNGVLDTCAATSGPSGAVVTMAAGQRIYLGASNADPFSNPAAVQPGTEWLDSDPATGAVRIGAGGLPALVVSRMAGATSGVQVVPGAAAAGPSLQPAGAAANISLQLLAKGTAAVLAPTPTAGDSSAAVATTRFVQGAIGAATGGAAFVTLLQAALPLLPKVRPTPVPGQLQAWINGDAICVA